VALSWAFVTFCGDVPGAGIKHPGATDTAFMLECSVVLPIAQREHVMPRPVSSASSKLALKSPFRAATMSSLGLPPSLAGPVLPPVSPAVSKVTSAQLRQMQISEFAEWLRTQTNKLKRPFQEQTILGYAESARWTGGRQAFAWRAEGRSGTFSMW
jgi:hypothetical protein